MQSAAVEQISQQHCLHCGLAVPKARFRPQSGAQGQFCCAGCELVHGVISENGLDYFYRLKESATTEGIPASAPGSAKDFAYVDTEEFQQLHVRTRTLDGQIVASIDLFLEGVHCAACVWLLEKLPLHIPGLLELRVSLGSSTAEVSFDPVRMKLSELMSTLSRYGYRPHPFRGANYAALRAKQQKQLLSSLGIAGACAGNVMLLSICLYAGAFGGAHGEYGAFFRFLALLLTLPTILWSARLFYKRALAALSVSAVHLDVPISLGILSAFTASTFNTLRGSGEVYFDSINIIVFLLLVSRFLQFRAQNRANEKAELLFSLLPSHVHLITETGREEFPLDAVKPGQRIEILPGETVPVDGVIRLGEGLVDCSVLTGEAEPISVSVGTTLHAGMNNTSTPLELEVTSTGERTRIGRLSKLATDMQKNRPQVLHLVDRMSVWFVVLVLALSALAFLAGAQFGMEEGFERFIAVLIISCPCALGMATPLALSVGLGNAARRGIHLRTTTAIELAAQIRTLVFDKTGTLTKGKFELHELWGDESVLPLVAAVERYSSHVVARALVAAIAPDQSRLLEAEQIEEVPGKGISGEALDGNARSKVLVGNIGFVEGQGILLPDDAREAAGEIANRGMSPIAVAVDGEIRAIIGLGDAVHDDAVQILGIVRRRGYETYLLSGDNAVVVSWIGRLLGFASTQVFGGRSPEEKVSFIQELQKSNSVMMFGDGTNDAAALATASVGVAVHGGAEASFLIADGFFSRPDLRLVVHLLEGARATLRVVHRGLASSLCFNLFGCGLAIAGYISPLVAAVLMPASSFIVVVLAFSQRSFLKSSFEV